MFESFYRELLIIIAVLGIGDLKVNAHGVVLEPGGMGEVHLVVQY